MGAKRKKLEAQAAIVKTKIADSEGAIKKEEIKDKPQTEEEKTEVRADLPQQTTEEEKKKVEEEEKPKSESETKRKSNIKHIIVDPYSALIKILKHIGNESKYSKCLSMLKKLVCNCIDALDPATIFTTLDLICWSPHKYKSPKDADLFREVFSFVLGYSEDNSPYFSSDQEVLHVH